MRKIFIVIFSMFFLMPLLGCLDLFEGPEVVSVTPEHNSSAVDPATTITIQFSKTMDIVKTNNEFTLSSNSGQVNGYFRWENGNKTLVFEPKESLNESEMYTISVSTSAEDKEGNDLVDDFESVFYISNDMSAPAVVSITPDNDALGVLPDQSITVVFSEAIDLNTIYSGLTLSPAVEGSYQWNIEHTEITFVPLYEMSYGTNYTISVSQSIKDTDGNKLSEDINYNFTVGDDFEKPTLAVYQDQTTPVIFDEEILNSNIEKDQNLVLEFSELIDTDVLSNSITISPSCEFYITTENFNSGSGDQTRAYIKFTNQMESEENYTLTVLSTVTDLQNNPLDHDYSYHYITDGVNSISPVVLSIGNGAEPITEWNMGEVETLELPGVDPFDLFANIKINFSNRMVPTSISVTIDTVVGSGGIAQVIDPDWPESTSPVVEKYTQFKFDVDGVVAENVYKITITGGDGGARDINGNYLKDDFVQYIRF